MKSVAIEVLALLVYGPLLVLLHEAGHAAFARLGGYRVTSFGIGLGRPLWSVSVAGGVVLHVDRALFAGGACVAIPTGPPTSRRAWFHGGGLIVQAGLAVVLLALPDAWLWTRIEQFNVLVALTNLAPWRVGGSASDGWYLLDVVLGGRRAGEILPQRPLLQRLAAREAAVGSPVGTTYADLCLAWADVIASRTEGAADFFTEDPPESAVEPWLDALYHYVLAEFHRQEGRPLAALRVARETRGALGDDLGEHAVGLLTLAEARALVDLGNAEQAEVALARIAGAGSSIGRQAAAIHLHASLDSEPSDLEYATWRVARRVDEPWLDPIDVVAALWEAGSRLQAHGRVQAARGAREAATTLGRRTVATACPEDKNAVQVRLESEIGLPTALHAAEDA